MGDKAGAPAERWKLSSQEKLRARPGGLVGDTHWYMWGPVWDAGDPGGLEPVSLCHLTSGQVLLGQQEVRRAGW